MIAEYPAELRIRLSQEMKDELYALAEEREKPVAVVLRELITELLEGER